MATHSSIFAWRIPWTEEPHGLQSMGLQRVRHNWANNAFTLCSHTILAIKNLACFLLIQIKSKHHKRKTKGKSPGFEVGWVGEVTKVGYYMWMIRLGNGKLIPGKDQVSEGKSYEEQKEIKLHFRYLELESRCGLRMIWTNCIRNPSFRFAYLFFVYFNLWEELLHAAVDAAACMLWITFFSLWPETKVCSLAYRSENFCNYYAIQAGWHAPLCG